MLSLVLSAFAELTLSVANGLRVNSANGAAKGLARGEEMLRCAQHDTRGGSMALGGGSEMLPLRFAQGFGSRAQQDTRGGSMTLGGNLG